MIRHILIVIAILTIGSALQAQPRLRIKPDQIRFEDLFSRLENIYLINEGDELLSIDSISYHRNLYYIRFDRQWQYPLYIAPGDTVEMDCILSRYFSVTAADTVDTMYVYHNGYKNLDEVEIKIDFHEDEPGEGIVSGLVSDGSLPIYESTVYFFYAGRYLIDSALTDNAGFYSKNLPEGVYTAAAARQGYYLTFYGQSNDPFTALQFIVKKDSAFNAGFSLSPIPQAAYSLAGRIFDNRANARVRKGIIVIRTGTHNPSANLASLSGEATGASSEYDGSSSGIKQDGIYSAIVRGDGSYTVEGISQAGYYYAQAFSDFFLPGYYNNDALPSVFWQEADSIMISGKISDRNITIARDSSFGGGIISGKVSTSTGHVPGDVIIYAISLSGGRPVLFTYAKDNGQYTVSHLPYGRYRLMAQKIGLADAFSRDVIIDPVNHSAENVDIRFITSGIKDENAVPEYPRLFDNYPNPFNPYTNIEFFIPLSGNVSLRLLNSLGQETGSIFEGYLERGNHKLRLNGTKLTSGVYFVRLKTREHLLIKKILLLK